MNVSKRKKRERSNPEIEVDAFAEDGMVVVQFGESEIIVDPEEADKLADLITDAAIDATEEDLAEDLADELEEEEDEG